jgi:2,4-dienoyl-CoA reductase-like NADH-dependent reductase (Old Yellow Enzyme family)
MSYLFSPISIRGEIIKNRIFVSPMCQYSSEQMDGTVNDWHKVHLGTRAIGGAGLVMIEASAVDPVGRITPWDVGLWNEEQAKLLQPTVNFITENGSIPSIQLAHAGRKASHDKPWNGGSYINSLKGGWDIVAPSAIPYDENCGIPASLTSSQIEELIGRFVTSAKLSVATGIKVIELHFAHGYLINEFMSPISNTREDEYGGDFKHRVRLPLEIINRIRKVIPESMPLFMRISCSEHIIGGWSIDDSIQFSQLAKNEGVDLIDCSSGGNSYNQEMRIFPGYQVQFSESIKANVDILTGAVGLITQPEQAEEIIANNRADVVLLGRELLRNPYWPVHAQKTLDGKATFVDQYLRSL